MPDFLFHIIDTIFSTVQFKFFSATSKRHLIPREKNVDVQERLINSRIFEVSVIHSYRSESTGSAVAALNARKDTVIKAMNRTKTADRMKTPALILIR